MWIYFYFSVSAIDVNIYSKDSCVSSLLRPGKFLAVLSCYFCQWCLSASSSILCFWNYTRYVLKLLPFFRVSWPFLNNNFLCILKTSQICVSKFSTGVWFPHGINGRWILWVLGILFIGIFFPGDPSSLWSESLTVWAAENHCGFSWWTTTDGEAGLKEVMLWLIFYWLRILSLREVHGGIGGKGRARQCFLLNT